MTGRLAALVAALRARAGRLAGALPRGLRPRLLGLFALGVLVPTFVAGAVVIVTSRRSLLETSLREQRETARRVADRVSVHVSGIKKVLLTVSSRGAFAGTRPSEQSAALRQLMTHYPNILECSVIGPSGRETLKVVRQNGRLAVSNDLLNRAGREEFRKTRAGHAYLGPVFFTARERSPQMFVAVPLGRRQGALLARLSLETVWELVSETAVGGHGVAYVVDAKGNLLAHADPARVLAHENLAGRTVVQELLDGRSETLGESGEIHFHEGDGGAEVLAVHHRLEGLGWGVIVERPLREALAPVRAMRRRVGAVLFTLGGLFLVLGLSVVRRILEPLRELQENAELIGRGDLKRRLDVRTGDEIQALAEEFNKMAESLEALEQTKRDLTHMIVHDLKSPLSGLLGSLDYVASGSIGAVTPSQAKILSLGQKSGKDLLRLIQNLLDLAKMEEGRLELRRESFSLLELAAECVDDLEAHIHRENKLVSVEVPKSLPKVSADRDLLYRVLTNLLTNALKHTSQGAEIAIRAGVTDDGRSFTLSVKDNGEGIPPEFLPKVFDKFGQAEAKKKRFRIGSGLGLTFCKLAVEAHGGRIWVESTLGKGSEFFLQAPVGAAGAAAAPAPAPETAAAV